MKRLESRRAGLMAKAPSRQHAQARTILLVLVCFAAGITVSTLWFNRAVRSTKPEEAPLSGNTDAVLQQLDAPVEIRFYSLLDSADTPESMKAYAARVEQLLAKYQRDGKGKIKVTRYEALSAANTNAAQVDGIKPFFSANGGDSYLGVAVVHNGQKQSLPSLSPEWEPALEFDLTRAISSLPNPAPVAQAVPADPGVAEAVKRAIPNLETVSLEEGTRILRQSALAEFAQAAKEMETQIQAAQQRLAQAQASQSGSDQQAAMQQLQQVQADQTDKLKAIAARSQAEINALQQLKSGGR